MSLDQILYFYYFFDNQTKITIFENFIIQSYFDNNNESAKKKNAKKQLENYRTIIEKYSYKFDTEQKRKKTQVCLLY